MLISFNLFNVIIINSREFLGGGRKVLENLKCHWTSLSLSVEYNRKKVKTRGWAHSDEWARLSSRSNTIQMNRKKMLSFSIRNRYLSFSFNHIIFDSWCEFFCKIINRFWVNIFFFFNGFKLVQSYTKNVRSM